MKRFLALGDSYTIGEGVSESERWPSQLALWLRARGIEIAQPHVIAQTAWTSDELADAIDADRPTGPFDLVTLMIGVNDQYRGRALADFTGYFEPLLRTTIAFADGDPRRVVLVSIPDWGYTPFASARDRALISTQIDAYNHWLRERASTAGAAWADLTPLSRTMLDHVGNVAADGLHPSAGIHRRWAEVIAPVAVMALSHPN